MFHRDLYLKNVLIGGKLSKQPLDCAELAFDPSAPPLSTRITDFSHSAFMSETRSPWWILKNVLNDVRAPLDQFRRATTIECDVVLRVLVTSPLVAEIIRDGRHDAMFCEEHDRTPNVNHSN